jgi:hypothetical protein
MRWAGGGGGEGDGEGDGVSTAGLGLGAVERDGVAAACCGGVAHETITSDMRMAAGRLKVETKTV